MKLKITISVLFAIILLSTGYLFYLHSDPSIKISSSNIADHPENNFDTNKIYYLENIPVVYIKGNGYPSGVQHGKLLKQQISEVIKIANKEILKTNTMKGFLAKIYLLRKAKQLDKYIPQIYREEMQGIADGATVSYSDILVINTFDDLLNLAGCSSIAVSKSEKNNIFIHARNLDYSINFLADKNIVFHYLDQNFISVGFPGYIGALSAVNYQGITLSSHTSSAQKNKIGMPTGILYRKIIETAETIDNVESILKNNPRTIGNNLLISSLKENLTAVFEITADLVVKRTDENHAIAANHFLSKELANINGFPPNSQARYNFLNNFYQNTKNISADKIKKAMSYYENTQTWSSVANQGTVQSVIFLPEQKIIYVAKGIIPPVTQDGYVEYNYEKFIK